MPQPSRSQRKRTKVSQPQQPKATAPVAAPVEAPVELTPAVTPSVAKPATSSRRRSGVNRSLEPVDYSRDYAAAREDLRWIAIWSILVFVVMLGIKFAGII